MLRTWNCRLNRRPRPAARPRVRLCLVELEDRTVLSVVYTPAQVVTAYGFNQIHFGTVPGDGRGQTIALVDAYADPHITSDLNAFSKQFGLPQVNVAGGPTFTVNDLSGGTPDPTGGNWEVETALDVEWAHAVAPQANILLVEAKDDLQDPNTGTLTSLMAAVNTAASTGGVAAVSMSWGVPEYPNEVRDDAAFAATAHPGVTFVAASGDSGAGVGFPSISPNVLSVGGTSLRIGANGSYQGETAWGNGRWSGLLGGSGGGRSAYEAQPSYQAGVVPASMSRPHGGSAVRTNPDVAYVADPNTGVVVYDNGNLYGVGGTSAGAPQWAALVAIADQGAALQGKGPLTGATQTLPAIYAAAQSDFHDVTRGSNGYSATVGYDLVTGRGSPKAPLVVNDLIKAATGAAAAVVTPAVGSSSITLMTTQTMQAPKKLPAPTPAPAASPHDVLSPNSSQTTGMTSPLPVSGTPAGATSATTTTVTVIVVAPPVVTSSAILPTAATVTAITAAPPTAAAFTTTVTGLAPQATFVTGNSGGGGSGDATLAPAVGQPGAPVDGNQAPAPDNPMPMPAVPDTGAPEAGAVLGDFGGGALAGDAADGAAAFGWDEGEYTALPDSGAAVAALLMALAYCGAGRTPRQEQDEGRRDWLAC